MYGSEVMNQFLESVAGSFRTPAAGRVDVQLLITVTTLFAFLKDGREKGPGEFNAILAPEEHMITVHAV